MTKNKYTRSHLIIVSTLRILKMDPLSIFSYMLWNIDRIKDHGGDRGVEGTIKKWIWDERFWGEKENSWYGDQVKEIGYLSHKQYF